MVASAHQHGAQHDDPSGRGVVSRHCPGDRSYNLHDPAEARSVPVTVLRAANEGDFGRGSGGWLTSVLRRSFGFSQALDGIILR